MTAPPRERATPVLPPPGEPESPAAGGSAGALPALLTTLELAALTALTLAIGWASQDIRGFPKGNDALGHLSKVRLILEGWPHINWNDGWYAGLPHFTGSYPPGYHLAVALLTKVRHMSVLTAMDVVTAVALVLVILGTYGFLRLATRSRTIGWVGALAVLAQPTFWSQSLEFGLYPRLLALGLGAAALPFAVLYARLHTRPRGTFLVLFLALSLSCHPVVGVVMTAFAAGVVACLGPEPRLADRAKPLIGPAVILVLLVAYFGVPLLLVHQGQSATNFIDRVPFPIAWVDFVWAHGGPLDSLVSWSPITLVLIGTAAVALARARRGPRVAVDARNLRPDRGATAAALDRFLTELELANADRRRYGPIRHLGLWSWLFAAIFFLYCVLQHFVATFPLYVNGLYPNALLVYAAFFALLGSAVLLTPFARRGAAPLLALAAAGVALLGLFLPGRTPNFNNPGRQMMEGMVALHIPKQHIFRIADADPDMALFLNAYTPTPQTDGYQPEGDIHLGWQIWLQDAILGQNQPKPARRFLFDWYAVKWILVHDPAPFVRQPSQYRLVERRLQIAPTWLWAVRRPTPIFTATSTAPLLFVGDALHYDLFLHALGAAGIGSRMLIPVNGGTSLDRYSLDRLRSYAEIVVWGSAQSQQGASLLRQYVRAGGRAFVDEGEAKPLFPPADEPVGRFAATTIHRAWRFSDTDPAFLPRALLRRLPPPNYAGQGVWQITHPRTQHPRRATVLARVHGFPALVLVREGSGSLVWSGLNIPYLASGSLQPPATRLLLELATGTASPLVTELGSTARRLDPEHWQFVVPPGTTQLLFRQYTNGDWHASDAATGAPLPIQQAGPGMTLVAVPPSTGTTTIDLHYALSAPEKYGLWTSALGVLVLLGYLVGIPFPRLFA